MATQATRWWATQRLISAVPLTVAALWLGLAAAPASVIPYFGFWFDFGVVPGVVLVALGLVVVAMWRGLVPRNALAWTGVATLGLILGVEAVAAWTVLTFPSGF
ncbi:MAG: hypothetical protein U0R78_14170 [Nocardioidaceae bacterium]